MMNRLIASLAISVFASAAAAETVPVRGEVVKINEAQAKVTLKHAPIPNLDMDAMTMVFIVTDPTMLKMVEVGDKVTFEADRVNGRISVTRIAKTD